MTTIKAHFDGRVLVPEQPVELPVNCILEVTVRPLDDSRPHPQQRTLNLLTEWEREDQTSSAEQQTDEKRIYDEIESHGIARARL